jgi:N-acetyltransferase
MRADRIMHIEPVTLQGKFVRLEPLTRGHLDALCKVGLSDAETLFRWFTVPVHSRQDMEDFIESGLVGQAKGSALPFATVDLASGQVVGSTRYGNIDRANRRVEIGWTWIGLKWQRTGINTEAKYLMLRHAFETLGCIRVELKTDALNKQSRAAIARLGATEEGTFRSHMITATGRIRDSVYFSIIDREWPAIKQSLESKMQR